MATPKFPECNRCGHHIADLTMPGLNGFGLADELKLDQRVKIIPVVFVSARWISPLKNAYA
jgi:CheY-like chemotaxis protein